MKRLITLDDFIETYTKLNQRGLKFIASKFNFNDLERAKTAFNYEKISSANWWIIPKVKERWNSIITGNKNLEIEEFIVKRFLSSKKDVKMLSLGSGSCYSELKFAEYPIFNEILCTDIADKALNLARTKAKQKNLSNINFEVQNVNTFNFPKNYFDIVYFRSSLHHFKNIEKLLGSSVKETLKNDGLLIINEYVGPDRFQFSKHQMKSINKAMKLIPKKYRQRFNLKVNKNKIYGSGLLRMIIADPSESIESSKILPIIHKNYETIHEAGYGGNILKMTLKDIAHHFIELDEEKDAVLNHLFEFEDDYLKKHNSDYYFGVYKSKNI